MNFKWMILAAMSGIGSCSKEDVKQTEKTAIQLLTQKEWVLSGYGYDRNDNGIIDASEESIQACEEDNTFSFHVDGSGMSSDNRLTCGTGIAEQAFAWKLINQNKELDLVIMTVRILRLTENELIISNGTKSPKFITVFRH
jgi:hypothetical protein